VKPAITTQQTIRALETWICSCPEKVEITQLLVPVLLITSAPLMNLHIHAFSTGGKHGTRKEPRLKKGLKLWVLHIFLFLKFKTVHCTIGVEVMHQQIQRKLQHEWLPGSVQKGRMSAT
jgi:hypothetical protein